jgi:hypothetical protein
LLYAAFFNFAHRARCATAILRRAAADIVCFAGAVLIPFPAAACDSFLTFAHLALCAAAIRFRAAAEMARPGRALFWAGIEPFCPTKSSMTEIADCNFST